MEKRRSYPPLFAVSSYFRLRGRRGGNWTFTPSFAVRRTIPNVSFSFLESDVRRGSGDEEQLGRRRNGMEVQGFAALMDGGFSE